MARAARVSTKRSFRLAPPRKIALACIVVYISVTAISIVVAHILLIAQPESRIALQIIVPVARGLQFLDDHWKVVAILIAPFAAPLVRDLLTRVRKFGDVEFDPVPLEPVGVREKPSEASGERPS